MIHHYEVSHPIPANEIIHMKQVSTHESSKPDCFTQKKKEKTKVTLILQIFEREEENRDGFIFPFFFFFPVPEIPFIRMGAG